MSLEQRVYAHYKSVKHWGPLEYVVTMECGWVNPCQGPFGYLPHTHGYNKTTTPNNVWLHLAHVHKIPVRQVKDIVTAEREARRA